MGTVVRGSKSSSGTTAFADNTDARADEINTDFNTLYNVVNGNLDEDNLPALPWANVTGVPDPEDIDDHSASDAEYLTETDPGNSGTTVRPTDLSDELERIRYVLARLGVGQTVVRRDTNGAPANEVVGWIDAPPKGRNLAENSFFSIYTGDSTAQEAPDHWTKVATPTTLAPVTLTKAEGYGRGINIVADAGLEGIQQTVTGLKASTHYLLTVTAEVAVGQMDLSTTGSDGANYDDVSDSFTDAALTTKGYVILTDATPTDIVIKMLSDANLDDFTVASVLLHELAENPKPARGGYTTQASRVTEEVMSTAGLADISDLEIAVVCPGPGYEIVVDVNVCATAQGAAAEYVIVIDENASTVRTVADLISAAPSVSVTSLSYVNEDPTPGTTYTYKVQAANDSGGGAVKVSDEQTIGGAAGSPFQTESTLTVSLRERS